MFPISNLTDLLSTAQAFAAVVSQAAAGNTSNTNVSASDVRAMVTLAYLSLNPNFPGLNDVLYGALNGNWTALQWAGAYGPGYLQSLFPSLTTLCLDQCASVSLRSL